MNTFEEINALSAEDVAAHLRPARNGGVVCPKCGNGSGDSGTGIKSYLRAGIVRWKCHKCGEHYSNVDLLAAEKGLTAAEVVAEYESDNNISFLQRDKPKAVEVSAPMIEEKQTAPKDYSKFYRFCRENLEKYGGEIRGLPKKFLRKVGAGYLQDKDGKKWLILPYNKHQFFKRELGGTDRMFIKGKRPVYNPLNAFENELLFVTEGEIDALSIMFAIDFNNAISVGSAENFLKLPQWLDELKLPQKPQLILIADNDETGKAKASAAVESLRSAGYKATFFTFSDGKEKVDANSILQGEGGRDKLIEKIVEIISLADSQFREMEREKMTADRKARIENEGAIFGEYFDNEFEGEVAEMQSFNGRSTGFKNIDNQQILLPSLYIVGGVPSIGKTAFLWQLLNQMAQNGETCIYCSYEMSRLELFSKSIARAMYLSNEKKAFTAAEIRRGSSNDLSKKVIADFKQSTLDLRVIELSDENIDSVLEKLKKICARLDKPPVIAIDYLQIIPSDKDTAKSAVDDTARKLKVFQRGTGTTFFVVSNLNRANYTAPIAFESFKESGGIEYSADVVWGLQFYITKKLSNVDVKGNREKIDAAKKENPRKVHLKCLKNRNGGLYDCYFKYNPANEYFQSVEETEFEEETKGKVEL